MSEATSGEDVRVVTDVATLIRATHFSPKRAPNFPDVPTTEETTSQVAQGCAARLCGAQGPAEVATIKKVWDRAEFKESMNRRGFQHDLSGFGWLRGVFMTALKAAVTNFVLLVLRPRQRRWPRRANRTCRACCGCCGTGQAVR
jgi:hypothetical protein